MRRFLKKAKPTKNPPPTPGSPIVGSSNQGPTTVLPLVEELGTLAGLETTIPIEFLPRDTTSITLDEPRSSNEPHWRTAYEAAKIAIDIANASSDMFLPLKAVAGALSVLVRNYDVRFLQASRPIGC